MTDRKLEYEIEVEGSPEEVWRAIATGPGISSWYVPHEVDEREGGSAVARFGPGPEMEVPGRVAAWDPPHRVVFDGGDAHGNTDPGMAFEWLIEATSGDTCIVRLVNSGFGSGDDWDAQYDGMKEGWKLFLLNLQLHLRHFSGQSATAALPMAMWPGSRQDVWAKLTSELDISNSPDLGERVTLHGGDGLQLVGEVVDVDDWRLALVVDEPAPGTAFIAAEGDGEASGVSIWSYLYGNGGAAAAARDEPLWQEWLAERGS